MNNSFYQRQNSAITMNDIGAYTGRSVQSPAASTMPVENKTEIRNTINEFVVDDQKQDILIYEVEVKDKRLEKLSFQKYLQKHNYIHIPPVAVFAIFNVSFIIFMFALLFLLIALIGSTAKKPSSVGFNETCSNTIECSQPSSLVCDYSTGRCACDATNGYAWISNKCLKCPNGWHQAGSNCYLSSGLKTNYTFASNWCELKNSKLAVFKTTQELTELETIYTSVFTAGVNRYYIGCTDLSSSSIKCLDNSSPINSWCSGAQTGTVGKRCVIIRPPGGNLCFDIVDCNTIDSSHSFMCQISL